MVDIDKVQDQLRLLSTVQLSTLAITREGPFGAKLSAEVSPCCWMYPGYPFQISVTMAGGGFVIVKDHQLTFAKATVGDMRRLLDSVGITKCTCRGCANPAFDPVTEAANRKGECKKCFMAEFDAKLAKEDARHAKKLAALDAKYKNKGATHRVDMWVHLDGDDQHLTLYMINPTDTIVRAELRKRKSAVLDDYKIVPL